MVNIQFLFKCKENDLTVFAFAFLDKCFIFDVLVASLTVKPSPEKKQSYSTFCKTLNSFHARQEVNLVIL